MTISALASSLTASSTTSSALNSLSGNEQTFLQLLTTQLQNQDPLSPTDTNTFTQQLVEYSQVEQQIDTNTKLDTLTQLQVNLQVQSGLSMIGKDVQFAGSTFNYPGTGTTNLTYNLPSAAATDTINVTDSNGNVVYSAPGSLAAGDNQFAWDGSTNEGTTAPAGNYNVVVSAADTSGNNIAATTSVWGQVTSMDATSSDIMLMLSGGQSVSLENVSNVQPDPGTSNASSNNASTN